jgi:phosphopantetheinyl transferase (holo-ACP synthase)
VRLVSSGSDVYYTVEWALKRSAEVELEGDELELEGKRWAMKQAVFKAKGMSYIV